MTPDAARAALGSLLPEPVALAASTSALDDGSSYDAEVTAAAGMAPGRRAEFRTGRTLARRALAGLDLAPVAVPVGPRREPVWPPGVVGSITHCPGLYAVAVAHDDRLAALGLDAEPADPLPLETRPVVATDAELAAVAALGVPDRLVFAAKEAVFKAWFPRTRAWLDFLEVRLDVLPDGRFAVVPVTDRPGADWLGALEGRWALAGEHLLCVAFSVEPARRPS